MPFEVTESDMSAVPVTRTKIMLILGNPDLAFSASFLPIKGVRLRLQAVCNFFTLPAQRQGNLFLRRWGWCAWSLWFPTTSKFTLRHYCTPKCWTLTRCVPREVRGAAIADGCA